MAFRPHLLILACSQTKDPAPGLLPAFERYQGGQYRVVRRAIRAYPLLENLFDLVIVSAHFGFLRPDTLIPDYNQKLDLPQMRLLQPQVCRELDTYLSEHETGYREIFVAMGKLYCEVIQPSQELQRFADRVEIAPGGIGEKAAALKTWLLHLAEVGAS